MPRRSLRYYRNPKKNLELDYDFLLFLISESFGILPKKVKESI